MPAQSKAQQQFFGMVHSMQKGNMPKKGHAGEVAKSISKKDAKDFASTPTKGLPKKVTEAAGFGSQSSYKKGDKVTVRSKGFNHNDKNKYVRFTSGTVSEVIPPHGHFASTGKPFPESYKITPNDRSLSFTSISKNMKPGWDDSVKEHSFSGATDIVEPNEIVKEETGKYAKTLFTADKEPIFIDDTFFDEYGTELIVKNDNYHGKVYVYDANQKDKFFIDPKDLYFVRPKKASKLKEASEIIPNSIRYEISKIIDKLYNKNRNTTKMNGRILRTTSTTPLRDIKDELESHGYTPEQIAWGMGIAKDQGLKEACSRSKFKSGQTVIAKSNFQGLKTGEKYKVVNVDVTWIMGQGYTAVTVKDKFGKEIVINNPQIAFDMSEPVQESLNKSQQIKLIDLLKAFKGKKIPDDVIHKFADEEKIDTPEVESFIYGIASRSLKEGLIRESLLNDVIKAEKYFTYKCKDRHLADKWNSEADIILDQWSTWQKAIQEDPIEVQHFVDKWKYATKMKESVVKEVENDQIKGGKADNKSYSDFDQEQLKKGIKVEMEHTDNPSLAKEIAADHLAEFPNYYDELAKMENKMKQQNEGIIRLVPMLKKKSINEQSYAALVKLPDNNPSFIQDRINKVAAELNGKVDPYHEGGDSYKLIFKSPAGLKMFIDKARALFGRSGAEIEMQEGKVDNRPTQMLTAGKKKLTEEYNTSMILPSSTRLNSEAPEKNVYTSDWMTDKDDGTIYLVNFNGKKIFVYSSGKPDPNDKFREGTTHEFKHDQTYKRIGTGKIEKIVLLSKLKGSHLGNYPLYVFK
jgi:hypothetical protein